MSLTLRDLEKLQAEHPDWQMEDPRSRSLEVYRPGMTRAEAAEVLRDGDVLTVPELLPGWELPVAEIWAPKFD